MQERRADSDCPPCSRRSWSLTPAPPSPGRPPMPAAAALSVALRRRGERPAAGWPPRVASHQHGSCWLAAAGPAPQTASQGPPPPDFCPSHCQHPGASTAVPASRSWARARAPDGAGAAGSPADRARLQEALGRHTRRSGRWSTSCRGLAVCRNTLQPMPCLALLKSLSRVLSACPALRSVLRGRHRVSPWLRLAS